MSYYSQATKRDILGVGTNTLSLNRKKIKNFSYCSSERIGKGFSSIVYKGSDDNTNDIVAIKCIDMKGVKDSISRQMLECQIQALTTLKHPNILQCFDVVKQTSHCYIVTQYCNDGDLSMLLKKKRRLTQKQTTKILKDIVSGFVQIGEKNFLHRDLKLANIFISNGNAKIADFGFAKKNKNSFQKQKYNVGSPLYMSPQALKKNIYSLKNDIWSIGVMAYQLLHGQTPWECRTQKQLMEKMIKIPVRFKDSLNISTELKNFIKKCLQVDQNKRMSLQELKKWNFSSGTLDNQQRVTMPPKLNLTNKPNSAVQNLSSKPLSQLTNRPSSRTQRAVSTNQNNKQNRQITGLSGILPKQILDRNNTIIVNQINTYRLLYKILQKLKKNQSDQIQLINQLGNQVIKKVSNLKSCCIDGSQKDIYDLKQIQLYLSQSKNPSIKKYKSVITQYYKKYTSQISSSNTQKQGSIQDYIKNYLKKQYSSVTDDYLMYYWMIEYLSLPKDPKKEYLDAIIQPKLKLNKEYIQQRVKQISN